MVVGDDVTVRTDDYSGSAALLFPGLLASAITEEILEERVYLIVAAGPGLDGNFYKNYGIDRRFCRVCEIGIVCLCQIDSPVH